MADVNKKIFDVIIIGAGASGMMAAITAARRHKSVLILEKMSRPGKKLLATGNGKCNFTNALMQKEYYYGDRELADQILQRFSLENCLKFFHEIGVYPKNKNGYYYPNSGQAESVLQLLVLEMERLGVVLKTEVKLHFVGKERKGFVCRGENQSFIGKNLVFATGLLASPKLGSDGSAFPFIKSFGHRFAPVLPALCGFYCTGLRFKQIAGVRCDALLTLEIQNKQAGVVRGELQLTDYGVSGIPVFQLSSQGSRALYEKKDCRLHIDFLPDMSCKELEAELTYRIQRTPEAFVSDLLLGLLPKKLALECLRATGVALNLTLGEMKEDALQSVLRRVKDTKITLNRVREAEYAQVCTGGIVSEELNRDTLESRLCPGVYFAGELLNVDGMCGGYNLHFAWASGYVVGNSLK